MKVQVSVNNVKIIEPSILNENEYNIHECEFEFTEEYNSLTKKAVFTNQANETYVETIVDDKCSIPSEVLKDKENVKLGVYAYDVENEELLLRYSPRPTEFYVHEGSYKEGQNSTPPTPSEVEQLQAQITSNKNEIEEMQGDIVDINSDIADIKAEQTEQNTNIQNNTDNISTINGQIVTINQDIDNLESTKADKSEIPTKTSDLINDSDFVSDANYVHTDNNFNDTYKNQITQNASDISNLQSNKADKSEIPTKVSQLTNDSGYITKNVDDLANYYKKNETYDKNEIDTKISSVYRYKGSVATYEDLPSTDLTIGDVYNVESDGSNYAWTGTTWDKLGGDIDLSEYYTKTQTDSLLSAKANFSDVYTKNETYNKAEVNTLLNDKVDKEQGKGLSSNDFTDNYKNQIEANQTAITNIKDGTTIDSFGDVETALNDKEDKSNKVTELTDQSTDVEYPSAKCVYDELEAKQSEIDNLQQDVEDLRNASYKVPGTGTDITLNNTAKGRLLKNDLSGRTEQEQLSGKNLFELTTPTISEGTKVGDLANGYWYKGNKSSSTGEYAYSKGWLTLPFTFEANENHVLTFNIKQITAGYTNKIALRYEDTATNLLETTLTNTLTRYNVLLNPSVNKRVYIALSSNEIQITDIQVEQGSTATSYEPYCGGIPSPNPDFPQQIKNVTGNTNVKIQNKNLFVFKDLQEKATSFDITGEKENFTIARKSTNSYNYPLSLPSGKSYTFSGKWSTTYGNGALSVIYTDGTSAGYILTNYSTSSANGNISLTTNASKTISHIKIELFAGGNYTIENLQIEQGTTATSYVEHQEQNYPFTFAEGQRAMQGTQLLDDGIHNTWKQLTITEAMLNPTIVTSYSELDYIRIGVPRGYIGGGRINVSLMSCANENKTWEFNDKKYIGTYTNRINYNDFYIGLPKGTSYDDIKNEIIGQVIEYKLADSALEDNIIPYNETQQSQYNAIKQARSYDDITYITSTSDELGFNMNVESLGNINKVINNLLNN